MADLREGQGAAPLGDYPQPVYGSGHRVIGDEPYPRTFVAKAPPTPQQYAAPVEEVPDTTQSVQAAVEGVVEADVDPYMIEFMGKSFRMAENVSLMPLLKFAHASKRGLDSDDMEGLDAMYRLIRSTLDRTKIQATDDEGQPEFDEAGDPVWEGPSQWDLFEEHADEQGAEGSDLMDFVNRVMPLIAARPKKPRGDSSTSSRQISARSKDSSSSPDMDPRMAGLTPVADLGRR